MRKNIIVAWLKNTYLKHKLHNGYKTNKIVLVNDNDRCTGKTTLLVNLSRKHNMPIFVPTRLQSKCLNEKFKEKDMFLSCSNTESLRGKLFPNGVLIDEGVSMEQMNNIEKCNIKVVTGFYYNHRLI